ncbi:hypothetical protein Tco_0742516 [Tanacetum coccineum]
MPCILCPDGSCPSDCPALDLFPSEEPYKEQSIVLAKKLMAVGFKLEFIKDCLRAAKVSGGLAAQKDFVLKIIMGHEAMSSSLGKDVATKKRMIAKLKDVVNAECKEVMEAIEAQFKIHELVEYVVDINAALRRCTNWIKRWQNMFTT